MNALEPYIGISPLSRYAPHNTVAQPRAEIIREASTQLFASAAARR